MVWRCRNSAAADRRALHSDYTSVTEKTPTPLNGRCMRTQNPSRFALAQLCTGIVRDADTHSPPHRRASCSTRRKPRFNRCFRASREFDLRRARAMRIEFDKHVRRRKRRRCVGFTHAKKFFHRRPFGGVAPMSFRSKRSESLPTDSHRQARSYGTRHFAKAIYTLPPRRSKRHRARAKRGVDVQCIKVRACASATR